MASTTSEWYTFEDVDAIRDYLARREPDLRKAEGGEKLLANFRKWYANITIVDKMFALKRVVGEAKWYRNQANHLLGEKPDPAYPTVDAEKESVVPSATTDPTPKEPWLPGWVKGGLLAGGVLLGVTWYMSRDDD